MRSGVHRAFFRNIIHSKWRFICMKYIDYKTMKDFYTVTEVCRLFEMNKQELRYYSEKYNISPQEDQYGNWGFRKVLVRKLHNAIYKEQKKSDLHIGNDSERRDDPWA